MTAPRSRGSTLRRWLIALLLLAALAWGLGELRSERGAKPEMGVGDLRQSEEPATVEPRAPDRSAGGTRPRPAPGSGGADASAADDAGGTGDEARASER